LGEIQEKNYYLKQNDEQIQDSFWRKGHEEYFKVVGYE
jgi:hypothetical protein